MGKTDISQSKLIAFARVFNVTLFDLLGFEQAKEIDEQKEMYLFEEIQKKFGKEAIKLLDLFCTLNSVGKQRAIETLEDLSSVQKYIKEGVIECQEKQLQNH